ncbi:MAG: hypothetical protein J5494_02070, partial [Candidatus Methanomethylophilaceae archaeon]|nr:hypothetical protein [Candidatus Methanomethylophilaceae archaeon]
LRRGCAVIERCAGIGYYEKPLPRGLEQTVSWIKDFSDYMNADKESAEMLCRELENEYREKMEPLKSSLDGVTAIVYAESSADINWLLETLCALGIQVPEILCPTNSIWNEADEVLEITRDIRIKYDMNLDDLRTELDSLKPTFFAGSSSVLSTVDYRHMILERPRPGISGCIEHAKRIVRMCRVTDYDFS